jgi:DHA1 family multidrug resistance protein-like MFS transporter
MLTGQHTKVGKMSNRERSRTVVERTSASIPALSAIIDNQLLRNRTLLAVSLTVFAAYTGIGMVGPVRVLYAQAHGASLFAIDAMASGYLIANFAFQYPVGWLADRWGRKRVMMVGLLVQALLSLLYILITDPIAFIVLRFLEGIAAASLLPAARALIIDTVPPEKQGEAYGIFGSFFNAGFLLGPGIGGLLATTNYASAFIGAVICRLIAIVFVVLLIPNIQHNPSVVEKPKTQVSYKSLLKSLFTLPLIGAYIIAFGDYLWLGFDQTLMPIWMHDHLGASVAIIGTAFVAWAIPNIILAPIGGRMADRRRRSSQILIFGLAQVPIYIVYGLFNSALPVIIFFALHSCVYAFVQPAIDSHVAAASGNDVRARVQGVYTSVGLIGAFVGSSGFTPLYTLNFRFPLFAMGIAFGICVIIGGTFIRLTEKSLSLPKK